MISRSSRSAKKIVANVSAQQCIYQFVCAMSMLLCHQIIKSSYLRTPPENYLRRAHETNEHLSSFLICGTRHIAQTIAWTTYLQQIIASSVSNSVIAASNNWSSRLWRRCHPETQRCRHDGFFQNALNTFRFQRWACRLFIHRRAKAA